ncbi:unnamed protein product, partial [Didymodactylos carnosus]
FIGEANIEWRKVDQNILKEIAEKRKEFNVEWKNPNIDYYVNAIRRDYLDNSLRNIKSIDVIRWFFSKAAKEQDPTYLVKAYTVEADYYKVLNQQLSTTHESDRHDFATDGRRRLLQILTSHPSLERYTFSGHTYRSMYVTEDELKDYYVGTRFMNKTFLSTSKDRQIAEIFSISSKKSDQKLSALCIYAFKNHRFVLDSELISEYPNEKEVIVCPLCVFEVTSIKRNMLSSISHIEIELQHCTSKCPIQ